MIKWCSKAHAGPGKSNDARISGQADKRQDIRMKPGPKKRRCLTRVGLLLVAAVLIAGMTGCSILPGSSSNPGRYNLTIISTDGGSVTSPGEDTFAYESGTSVDLEANPAEGYRFVNWTGNIGAVADPDAASTTITVNGRTHVIANFEQSAGYGITLSSGAGGSVTSPGEDTFTYTPGASVDLVARPSNGYRFSGWTGNVCTVADRNAASTTVTIEGHYSVTANFEQTADHREQTADYRLTLSSTAGGSVRSPGEATFAYTRGTSVNLVARPAYGHRFVRWTGDVDTVADRNAASTTITINGDYRVTANFEQTADHSDQTPDYDLTITSTTGGSVTSPGEGTFTYARGRSVNLVARPADGYRFVNWTGNTGTIANRNAASTTITINSNYSITANFEPTVTREYDLTITGTSGGSITVTVDGQQTVVGPGQTSTISGIRANTSVQLAANPHTGYHLARWQGAPVDGRRSARTSFTMQGDYSITANFEQMPPPANYDLTTDSTEGGSVTTPGEGTFTYDCGTVVNLVASPDSGYRFHKWTGHVDTIANVNSRSTTITMNGSYNITASFRSDDDPTPVGPGPTPAPARFLTVDWDEEITRERLTTGDRLVADLFGPSPDARHSLLLEQGTRAPLVNGERHYLIVIRELDSNGDGMPPLPDNTTAIVAFNITPAGAVFNREIFLTLGFDQLPEDIENPVIAYYDEVDGVWVLLDSEPVDPNGVAELNLGAGLTHFTIFAVLADVMPAPANFAGSNLDISRGVRKTWDPVTFITRTGETVTISAMITNDGGQTGTYTARLTLNGEVVDTATVTLDPGQSQTVIFTLSDMEYGDYEVEVAGLSGGFTTTRTINWWLIIALAAGVSLITWAVIWRRRKRRAAQQT